MFPYDSGFDDGFPVVFTMLFGIVFIGIIGVIIFAIVKGIGQWNRNNQSPILTVEAVVVGKRMSVSNHHHNQAGDVHMGRSSSTWYYVTFEVESGSRMELSVSGQEYGLLADGDRGRLTFQGTRYKTFEREKG